MHTYSQYLFIVFVSNSIVYLLAQDYVGFPRRSDPMHVALLRSFEFRCKYNGVGNGEFLEWFKKNSTHDVSVNLDKPGHYIVKHSDRDSNLTIRIFVESDGAVERWYVKTKTSPAACEFGRVTLVASPQGILDDKNHIFETSHESIRRTEDQVLNLKCLIEPKSAHEESDVKWEYSRDNKHYVSLPSDIKQAPGEIHIDSVQQSHRGYYRCKLHDIFFTVRLRVKDKLAALWPFLGIVGIILILVIIILIFEKRQKSNKKTTSTDEDDQDRPSDPLVQTTTKASDNDSKKRAVKA